MVRGKSMATGFRKRFGSVAIVALGLILFRVPAVWGQSSGAQPICDPNRPGRDLIEQAEELKRLGDPAAEDRYKDAIGAASNDPEYRILYSDYLRNFRGPQQPLFPEAEHHYYQALANLGHPPPQLSQQCLDYLRAWITRGLAALYERDGVPFIYWDFLPWIRNPEENRPLAFFSPRNRYERSLDEFDQRDEFRDLTLAAAEFATPGTPGVPRLGRPLTKRELRSLLQRRDQFETFNRFRLRYRGLPWLDFFFTTMDAQHAQITRFDQPGRFNDVDISQYGLAIERTFKAYPLFDFSLRTELSRGEREGLIEFLPEAEEDLESLIASGVFSRFWGPNKLNLEVRYVLQNREQRIKTPIDRDLEIVGATFRYQKFTPTTFARRFNPRASEFFFGVALGQEEFGVAELNRDDFFVGVAFRGLDWFDFGSQEGRFDFTIQPTLLTADRSEHQREGIRVPSFTSTQYRTAVTLLYRLQDYENRRTLEEMPPIGPFRLSFLNVVVPVAYDLAVKGMDDFENFSIGLELAAKLISGLPARGSFFGGTILATAGYTFQRFYRLKKNVDVLRFDLELGF